MKFTLSEARTMALAAGATMAEIESETELQRRHVGSVPFKNMIAALAMLPAVNDRADWTRLAAALQAAAQARVTAKRSRP